MIKILFSICRYEINGVSRAINNLIENLDIDKFSMSLLVQKLDKNHYPFTKKINILHLDVKPSAGLIGKIKNIFNIISSYRRMIKKEDPEIIVSFGYTSNCYILLASLFSWRRKVVISERSEKFYVRNGHLTPKERLFLGLYRLSILALYRRADFIVPVSNSIADIMKKRFLINKNKIRLIRNGIDIDKVDVLSNEPVDDFEFKKGRFYVGTVSRLSGEKGVEYLINAVKDLSDKLDITLLIVGDGDDRKRLEELVDNLGLNDRVYFLGCKINPYKYIKHFDVFVLASHYEGSSNVILEAMACKVPVIAPDTTSNREIINNNINGILINTANATSLSNNILNLFKDASLRENIRNNAYDKLRSFSLSDNIKQYEYILSSISHV